MNANEYEDFISKKHRKYSKQGKTTVFCVVEGVTVGLIALRDSPKPGMNCERFLSHKLESKFVIAKLKEMGIQVWMMSGDNQATATCIGKELGLEDEYCLGGMLPANKTERVKLLQEKGQIVCMVGDGRIEFYFYHVT